MAKCFICGKELMDKGVNNSGYCLACYRQKEKSLNAQSSTADEQLNRQKYFGTISLNEDMPTDGYGSCCDS